MVVMMNKDEKGKKAFYAYNYVAQVPTKPSTRLSEVGTRNRPVRKKEATNEYHGYSGDILSSVRSKIGHKKGVKWWGSLRQLLPEALAMIAKKSWLTYIM